MAVVSQHFEFGRKKIVWNTQFEALIILAGAHLRLNSMYCFPTNCTYKKFFEQKSLASVIFKMKTGLKNFVGN